MTSETTYGNLVDWEERLIARLLSVEFPGRKEITEQLKDCLAKILDQDGSLGFQIRSKTLAPVEKRVPVEAEGKDADGHPIHVLLHVVQGRVTELEIYREDGAPVQRMPDPHNWEVFVLPTAPSAGWLRTRPN